MINLPLIDLLDNFDKFAGMPFEFEGGLTFLQAQAVKKCLALSNYKAMCYYDKEAVVADLIQAAKEIYDAREIDYPDFDLSKKGDFNDFVWILGEELRLVLAKKYDLLLEQ